MEVIVVGGGIAGLSLALSLHQAGIAVRVYEAVSELSPLGVGINLQPAAVRELTELGLGNELAKIGIPTRRLSYFNKFGQLIWSEPRGLSAGYKWPQYSIHRGQLQMLLLGATRERIGDSNICSGMRFVSLWESRDRVTTTFCDSSGASIVDDADVLVGADGIHSAVRHHLHPGQGEPRFAQQMLWRAAVEAEPFLGGGTMIIAGHFHQRIVVYPMGGGTQRGRLLTNWVCQKSVAGSAPGREDWNRQTSKEEVLADFGKCPRHLGRPVHSKGRAAIWPRRRRPRPAGRCVRGCPSAGLAPPGAAKPRRIGHARQRILIIRGGRGGGSAFGATND
jgi:5-methylphenazine-1-carboxylate 1-monooxygenase